MQAHISSHKMIQGTFQTQALNPGLLHGGQILYWVTREVLVITLYIYKIITLYTWNIQSFNLSIMLNKSGRKRLYTVWFNLFGILENDSTDRMEIVQCFPGPGGTARRWLQRRVEKRLGEMCWNDTEMMKYSAYWLWWWLHSLCICQNL